MRNHLARMTSRFVITPAAFLLISGCAFFSDGVVTSVESHYIIEKNAILSISGETATHPLYGIFMVENPPREGKPYPNDDKSATLTFRTAGPRQQAVIEFADNSPAVVFDMHLFGGPKKNTVVGIFW